MTISQVLLSLDSVVPGPFLLRQDLAPAGRGLCGAGPHGEEGRERRAAPAEERRVLPHSGGPGGREGGQDGGRLSAQEQDQHLQSSLSRHVRPFSLLSPHHKHLLLPPP